METKQNQQSQEPLQKQPVAPSPQILKEEPASTGSSEHLNCKTPAVPARPGAVDPAHTPGFEAPSSVPLPEAKRAQRLPRVPLGEAFRLTGLDEWTVAQHMAGLVDTLKARNEPKLLLDALKESSRCLEGGKSGPVSVALVHHIPRPRRQSKKQPAPPMQEPESAGDAVE
jgi:hypothetical protein